MTDTSRFPLIRAAEPESQLALQELAEQAREYAFQAKAENTRRAYQADWSDFLGWCELHGRVALPALPETVVLYITDRAETCKVSTLQRRLSTISQAHQAMNLEPPTRNFAVRTVWSGIRRAKGVAPEQKQPVLTEDVRRMVRTLDESLAGLRDRALLVMGFAGAFRRSELVGLDVNDIRQTDDGLAVILRRSKTDQESEGRKVGLPYGSHRETCPVRCYRAWLAASGIEEGPIFRPINRHGQLLPSRLSGYSVALIVKRCAEAAGVDPAFYAGHSLRAGLITAAALAGASERSIMQQSGHKTSEMVRRYIRDANLFRENAAAKVGL